MPDEEKRSPIAKERWEKVMKIPLLGIRDLAATIEKVLKEADDQKKLKAIIRSSELMLQMLSGPRMDVLSFEAQDFTMGEFLQQFTLLIGPALTSKKCSWYPEVGADVPQWVHSDQRRLMQVLFEALEHVLGLTPVEGLIRMKVNFGPQKENASERPLVFSFENESSEPSPLQSEEFWAHALLKQLQGSWSVSFAPEKRQTQIHLEWPLRRFSDEVLGQEKKVKGRILVVEDDPSNQVLMKSMLEMMGHETVVAGQGEEAMALLEQSKPFHLVLMDVQMPVMDGYATAKKIRENEKFRTLPILALTGHDDEQEKKKCLGAGMNDYMAKPILVNVLEEKIKKWLKGKAHVDEAVLNRLAQQTSRVVMVKVVQSFLRGLDEFQEKSTANLAEKNLQGLKALAHRFKSSSASVGALGFSQLCVQMENPSLSWSQIEQLVNELKQLADEIKTELNELIVKEGA